MWPIWPAAVVLALACAGIGCTSARCGQGLVEIEGRCVDDGPVPCVPACDPEAHESCDDGSTPSVCKCATGYSGEPCLWTNTIIDDPGFGKDITESDWVRESGAGVVQFADGHVDPGEASLPASAVCKAGGLSQVIRMPTRAVSEPLVVEITYHARDVGGVAVGFDAAWKELPVTDGVWTPTPATFCLGEAAYGNDANGGEVKLLLSASEEDDDCFMEQAGEIRVDRVDIKPVPDGFICPEPGTVINGEADDKGGGWALNGEGTASAALEPGFGATGVSDSAVRLFRPAGTPHRASAATRLSVPLPTTDEAPALRFWWDGSSGQLFPASLGTAGAFGETGRSLDTLVGFGFNQTDLYCLPPWTYGSVVDLSFALPQQGTEEVSLLVDNVEILMRPECNQTSDILDPRFDSAPNRWPGIYLSGSAEPQAIMQSEGELERARSPVGVMELRYSPDDSEIKFEHFVLVPEPVGDDAPVVVFWSDVPAVPDTPVEWVLGRQGVERGALLSGGNWLCNEVPLPVEWAGRWYRLQIRVGPADTPPPTIESKSIFLDDFELTTASACVLNQ